MEGVPPQLFKIALNSSCDRLNVTTSLSGWLEDFAEIENLVGKSLCKIVNQAGSNSFARTADGMPFLANSFDDICKITIGNLGRKHMDFATNVSQNIVKVFPETTKQQRKRLQLMLQRITQLQENIKKNKTMQQRLLEKYTRLVKDAELTIKEATTNAALAAANQIPPTTSVDGVEESTLASGGAGAGGMKGSISKMFNKIAPEKKLQDRFRDLIKEIDHMEMLLYENVKKSNTLRQELLLEIRKIYNKDWQEFERNRLQMLKDGMSRMVYSIHRLKEKEFVPTANATGTTANATGITIMNTDGKICYNEEFADTEFYTILKKVDTMIHSSDIPNGLQFLSALEYQLDTNALKIQVQVCGVYCKIEKLIEVMDMMLLIVTKATGMLSEVSEQEKQYVIGLQRILEKHGIYKFPTNAIYTSNVPSVTGNSLIAGYSNTITNTATTLPASWHYGMLVQQYEYPAMKTLYETLFCIVGQLEELMIRSSDMYSSEIVSSLDAVIRRMTAGKKDLLDKCNSSVKKVESWFLQGKALTQKLMKLRNLIKERKTTLRTVKGGNGNAEDGVSGLGNEDDEDVTTTATSITTNTIATESTATTKFKATFQTIGVSLRAGMNLKQGLGLENVTDRILRIENQIVTLEEEEKQLTEQQGNTINQAMKALDECYEELSGLYTTTIEFVKNDFQTIKKSCNLSIVWQEEYRDNLGQQYESLRTVYDAYSLEQDLNYGVQLLVNASQSNAFLTPSDQVSSQVLFDIPTEEIFVPIGSEIILEQRNELNLPAINIITPVTTAATANVMMEDNDSLYLMSPSIGQKKNVMSLQPPPSVTMMPDLMNEELVVNELTPVSVFTPLPPIEEETGNGNAASSCVEEVAIENMNGFGVVDNMESAITTCSLTLEGIVTTMNDEKTNTPTPITPIIASSSAVMNSPSQVTENEKKSIAIISAAPLSTPTSPVRQTSNDASSSTTAVANTSLPFPEMNTNTNDTDTGTATAVSPITETVVAVAPTSEERLSLNETNKEDIRSVFSPTAAIVPVVMVPDSSNSDTISTPPRKDSSASTVSNNEDPLRIEISTNNNETVTSPNGKPSQSSVNKPSAAAIAMQQQQQQDYELKKFGLTLSDKILESFSCALYPKKGILTHGRMFITQHYVAFSSWGDLRVLLSLRKMDKVQKTNTMIYIPNAISIIMEDKEEYFFGSFIDRELCHTLLTNLMQIEKRIMELHRDDTDGDEDDFMDDGHLEFGYQTRTTSSSSSTMFKSPTVVSVTTASAATTNTNTASAAVTTSSTIAATSGESEAVVKGEGESAQEEQSQQQQQEQVEEQPIVEEDCPTFNLDQKYFDQAKILFIAEETMQDVGCTDILRTMWATTATYQEYLVLEGDIDIQATEWTVLPTNTILPEDSSKLNFQYSRQFNYSHKRTSMLMFGPPMALTKQTQYLYIPNHTPDTTDPHTVSSLLSNSVHPSKCVVMFITQFEGIPFADTFKVVQYFTIETKSSSNAMKKKQALIRVGVNIFFVKSTMFKGNIISGTKDEMTPGVKSYFKYTNEMLCNRTTKGSKTTKAKGLLATGGVATDDNKTAEEGEVAAEGEEEVVKSSTGSRRVSRRMSRRELLAANVPTYQWTELGYWRNLLEWMAEEPPTLPLVAILSLVIIWQWWSMRGLKTQITSMQTTLQQMQSTLEAIQTAIVEAKK